MVASMFVVNHHHVEKVPLTNPLFTGPDVAIQLLLSGSKEFVVNIVHFGKGVRNKFHSHSDEQILIVTSGKGIIATETDQKEILEGDVVLIPANEKHWHGSTKDSEFSHIYISKPDSELVQLEE
jgi:quercetin dioxygenase-like cupin family protein